MAREFALTTSDNPFNPITQWDSWYEFDEEKGYKTCQYLAHIAHPGSGLSEGDEDAIIEAAIDEIVGVNIIGLITEYQVNYKKVVKDS